MKQLVQRMIFGLLYVVVLLGSFYYSFLSFVICLFLLGTLCIWEYAQLIKTDPKIMMGIYIVSYFGFVSLFQQKTGAFYFGFVCGLVLFTTVLHTLLGIWVLKNKDPNFLRITRYFYIITAILCLFVLGCLPTKNLVYDYRFILQIFLLIWFNDSFAYLFGSSFGKTKLLPAISPKKTIEGAFGGLAVCIMICGFISKYSTEYSLGIWILIGILVPILGTLGDLVQSKFKRIAQVKDSGSVLPGHGGMFDRLDSILFVSPYIILILLIIQYVS